MLLSHALLRIKLAFVRSKRQLLTSSYTSYRAGVYSILEARYRLSDRLEATLAYRPGALVAADTVISYAVLFQADQLVIGVQYNLQKL